MSTIRCAIYTRKSVDEGLEQEFNSLDAQRAACESYIAAKRFEGWVCLPDHYDDGGFSGGNMKLPAITQLMNDVRQGKVDMVVCYKIDRLSRSIVDFSQFFTELEKHKASFSCVTQELNTTTSMGRMVMNLLMTFAQFERELCAERVTDKVAATRRKGFWTGGIVPFGYKFINKRLVPDPETAPIVIKIFEWYLELGTPKLVTRRLNEQGILRFPEKQTPWNTVMVGTALRNCVYVGKVPLKDEQFDGVHEAIVSQELWDKTQSRLNDVATRAPIERRSSDPALLNGLIRCGHCGDALSHTWTSKNRAGVKYAYYTCRKDMRRGVSTCPIRSISAQIIEPLVEQEVIRFLKTPTMLKRYCFEHSITPFDHLRQLANPSEFWTTFTPVAKRELLARVIKEINVYQSSIDIQFITSGSHQLIEEFKNEHYND